VKQGIPPNSTEQRIVFLEHTIAASLCHRTTETIIISCLLNSRLLPIALAIDDIRPSRSKVQVPTVQYRQSSIDSEVPTVRL
jgi:hypothetical protein